MPHASHFPTPLLHLPPRTLRTLWPLSKCYKRWGSVSDSLYTLHNNLIVEYKCFLLPPTPLVRKQSKTNKKFITSQTTECPKPSSRKGKGREGVERKGQRGWITLMLFLSFSSGWAESTKNRIYQSRWRRKMTWAVCFKEQAISKVYSYLLAWKFPQNTLQFAWARFDWTNIQLTAALPLDMWQCKC